METLGGIAEYIGIDSTVLRVIYVLLVFFAIGSPIIVYILLALIIPKPPYYDEQDDVYQSYSRTYYKKSTSRKDVTNYDDENK